MDDSNVREAAESLYGSFSRLQGSNSGQSVNVISEELVLGHRYEGRMSTVRRFFCLFVTFDVLFTFLMWLICVMMHGETISQIFNKEVENYSIRVSLFDIVVVSLSRFSLLIFFYALLHINNWSIIALTTAGTCTFLMAKVFVYDWVHASEPVFQVFLILASFTLAWGETWFLDFRVLPQELHAKNFFNTITSQPTYGAGTSEQAPLLRPRTAQSYAESCTLFFSPVDTPAETPRPQSRGCGTGSESGRPQVILTQDMIDEYKEKAHKALVEARHLLLSGAWKDERYKTSKGDKISTLKRQDKIFKFKGVIDCPAKYLFEELRDKIEEMPSWNPTLIASYVIKRISASIDLSYQVSASAMRELVQSRDFVTLRHCVAPAEGSGAFACVGVGVECPGYGPCKAYTRGENKITAFFIRPLVSHNRQQCQLEWLLCCNLKTSIPKFLLDTGTANFMSEYVGHLRTHIQRKHALGAF